MLMLRRVNHSFRNDRFSLDETGHDRPASESVKKAVKSVDVSLSTTAVEPNNATVKCLVLPTLKEAAVKPMRATGLAAAEPDQRCGVLRLATGLESLLVGSIVRYCGRHDHHEEVCRLSPM
jgi:hypothetical protein